MSLTDLLGPLLGRRIPWPSEVPEGAVPPGVILRRGRWIPWLGGVLGRMEGPASAVTLGRTIVVNPESPLTATLLTHELVHVRQWQRDSLFPVRYALATVRHGYRNNPYEVEAYGLASSEWPTQAGQERT